jgi:hypothetical protein
MPDIDIRTLTFEESWHYFISTMADEEETEELRTIYQYCAFGIGLKFDIMNWLEHYGVITKPKQGLTRIDGKWLKQKEINEELIKREILLKKYLINTQSPSIVKNRYDSEALLNGK